MDRASGSGVFARDPDAILSLTQLEVTEALQKQETNKAICARCIEWLNRWHHEDKYTQDDACSADQMLNIARANLSTPSYQQLIFEVNAAKEYVKSCSAWRLEGTLREFKSFSPINTWFRVPIHVFDDSDSLKDLECEGENGRPFYEKGQSARKKQAESENEKKRIKFENAVNFCNPDGNPTVKEVAEYLETDVRNVRNWMKKYEYHEDKNTGIMHKSE